MHRLYYWFFLLLLLSSTCKAQTKALSTQTLYCYEGTTVLPFVLEWADAKPPVVEQPGLLPHRKEKGYVIESMSPLQKGEYDIGIRKSAKNAEREISIHLVVLEARVENLEDIQARMLLLYFGSTLNIEAQTPDSNRIPDTQFITKVSTDSGEVQELRGRKISLQLGDDLRSVEYQSLLWENPVNKERIPLLEETIGSSLQLAPPVFIVNDIQQSPIILATKEERKDFQMKIELSNIQIKPNPRGGITDIEIIDVQVGIQKFDVAGYTVRCEGIHKVGNSYETSLVFDGPTPKKGKVEGHVIVYVKARAKNKRNNMLSSVAKATFGVSVGY